MISAEYVACMQSAFVYELLCETLHIDHDQR